MKETIEQPTASTQPNNQAENQSASQPSSMMIWVVGAVILLALVGFAAYWYGGNYLNSGQRRAVPESAGQPTSGQDGSSVEVNGGANTSPEEYVPPEQLPIE